MDESIGTRIRRLREERGLTQRSLTGPGVSAGYISRIESGQRVPSGRAIHVIAERLGIPPAHLTGSVAPAGGRREVELADAELELRFADNPGGAAKKFKQLMREAEEARDQHGLERAQAGLGLALVQQGEYEKAVALLKPVIEERRLRPGTDPDVFFALARGYVGVGLASAAVDLLRQCVTEVRESQGTQGAYVRLAAYLSNTLAQAGDADGARKILDEALRSADDAVDASERVRLYWSHARLATTAGDHAAAHRYIQRAIAILEEAEDTLQLSSAQLLSAENLVQRADWDEADQRLEIAERLLGNRPQPTRRMLLGVLRSQILNARGEYTAAERVAEEVRALAREDEPEFLGRAEMQLGEALWRQGRNDDAHAAFARAEELLTRGEPDLVAELFSRWADLFESEGRLSEALGVLRRSRRATPVDASDVRGTVPPPAAHPKRPRRVKQSR